MSRQRIAHTSLRHSTFHLGLLAAFGLPGAAQAANPGDPLGPEFRVNSFTPGNQSSPAAAVDADGDAVVVWEGAGASGDGRDIFAQRYNASGRPVGGAFRVNSVTDGIQSAPAVAIDAAGDFVIVWESDGQDGNGFGIFAQRYDAAASAVGGEFRANTHTTSQQRVPVVAADADGDVVIVWRSFAQDGDGFGIFAQRYDAAGNPAGTEFRVNSHTQLDQNFPTVTADADGDVVIAWQSGAQDGDGYGIFAQRYDAAGNPAGTEFRANTYTTSNQRDAAIAADANGNFLMAWRSDGQDGGNDRGVFAQRFDAAGNRVGNEFRANARREDVRDSPAVAVDADGDFVVLWESFIQDGSVFDTYARRFDGTGSPIGSEFRVNTFTDFFQVSPTVAVDADGDFLIAWESFPQDSSSDSGIFAQRYAGSKPIDLALTKLDAPDPLPSGGELTYTLRVDNAHASVAPTGFPGINGGIGAGSGLHLWDVLPGGTTFRSASGAGWNCAQALLAGVRGVECFRGDALAAGASSGVEITVGTPNGSTILRNVATLASDQFDPDLFNNQDSAETQVDNTAPTISAIADRVIAAGTALRNLPFTVDDLETPEGALTLAGSSNNPALVAPNNIVFSGGAANRFVTVLPNQGASGQALIQITVTDAEGAAATETFMLTVTAPPDTMPDAFAFVSLTKVRLNTVQTSNAVTITGINAPAPISVSGGSYSINGGAFTTAAGHITNGQSVRVRHTSSSRFKTAVSTTLNIGGRTGTFKSTTKGLLGG
ncbi:MAG: hypothetical protein ACT4QA_22470 [Panacagrimonas sp.]